MELDIINFVLGSGPLLVGTIHYKYSEYLKKYTFQETTYTIRKYDCYGVKDWMYCIK